MADQYGTYTTEGTVINLSLTQTDLAEMAGATRVSINKALGRFRRAGWIRITGKQVTVIDRAGLEGMTIVSPREV